MMAASIYIPKDDQDYPRGDDAHYVSDVAVAVADGVGGWRKSGIDGGQYARELMSNSVAIMHRQLRENGVVRPKSVLQEAYMYTTAKGSSTACIVTLSDSKLLAANVGDSGFLIVRNDAVLYKSPIQQKYFNCPYQLGTKADNPTVAQEIEVSVKGGDIVVLATDGFFDNVHDSEIVEVVRRGTMERIDLDELCCQMANVAHCNSLNRFKDSPFSIAARTAGGSHRGGKKDDITIVIARIN